MRRWATALLTGERPLRRIAPDIEDVLVAHGCSLACVLHYAPQSVKDYFERTVAKEGTTLSAMTAVKAVEDGEPLTVKEFIRACKVAESMTTEQRRASAASLRSSASGSGKGASKAGAVPARASASGAGQAGADEQEEGEESMEEEKVGRRDAEILRSVSASRAETEMVSVEGYGWVTQERAAQIAAERDRRQAEDADRRQRQRDLALARRAEREAGRPPPTERRVPQDWSEVSGVPHMRHADPGGPAGSRGSGGSRGWSWDER